MHETSKKKKNLFHISDLSLEENNISCPNFSSLFDEELAKTRCEFLNSNFLERVSGEKKEKEKLYSTHFDSNSLV